MRSADYCAPEYNAFHIILREMPGFVKCSGVPESTGYTLEGQNFPRSTLKSTTCQIEKLVAFSPKGGLPPAQVALLTAPDGTALRPAGLTSCATG